MGEVTQPRAAVLFACRDAEKAKFPHFLPEMHGKLVAAVDISSKRGHALAGKAAYTLPQHFGIAVCCVDQTRFIHLLLSEKTGPLLTLP